jgi:hypothetical protein
MLPKIISAIFGLAAVGIFIWKFKKTQWNRKGQGVDQGRDSARCGLAVGSIGFNRRGWLGPELCEKIRVKFANVWKIRQNMENL